MGTPNVVDNEVYLTKTEVLQTIKVSRESLRKLILAGEFPQPIRFGAKSHRWSRSEIADWMRSRPREIGGQKWS